MTPVYVENLACMKCAKKTVALFLDLGQQPSGNMFVTREEIPQETTYPLRMGVCTSCWQVQLLDHLDKGALFEDHPYLTGTNKPIVDHFADLAKALCTRYGLSAQDLVLDIGCNDGTLLSQFKAQGATTIGVEPSARISQMARAKGHVVATTFWGEDSARSFKALGLQPKLITAMSVFYHVSDLHDFLRGVESVMGPDSVFVIQAVSLMSLLAENQFDHFYHEHTCIHSVSSLQDMLSSYDLKMIDVQEVEVHGGAFIATLARRDSAYTVSRAVAEQIDREAQAGLLSLETYHAFARRVETIATGLRALLVDLKKAHKRVYGLGAPLKSSTFLNYANIDAALIECLTEVNALKIGKLSPGKHIPVVDERRLSEEPDYYVVFAWNYLEFLIEKKRDYLKAGGKFIVPFPELRVIGGDDI